MFVICYVIFTFYVKTDERNPRRKSRLSPGGTDHNQTHHLKFQPRIKQEEKAKILTIV